MPGFDDRLKQHLERAAPPADPSGAFDRILEKKIRRRVLRRFQAAGLAFLVVAGTTAGSLVLYRVFRSDGVRARPARLTGNGPILVVQSHTTANKGSRFISAEEALIFLSPDGTIQRTLLKGPRGFAYSFPTWSPDGNLLIVQVQEACCVPPVLGPHHMDLVRADGTLIRRLGECRPGGGCLGPASWSPDGLRIAVVHGLDIVTMKPDGTDRRTVATCRIPPDSPPNGCSGIDGAPTWSPNGSQIAFARETIGGSGSVYVVGTNGSDLRRITRCDSRLCHGGARDENPAWSPDGKWIAFDREFDIWLVRPDGTSLRNLTQCHASGLEGCAATRPVWSPNGRELLFERPDGIYVMNSDGTSVKRLITNDPDNGLSYGWPAWQPIPTSPTPTTSPFPARCDASQVTGDFDGDGQPDTATVAKTECFPSEPRGAGQKTPYSLQVRWPPSEGIAPLPGCEDVCQAVAAADLNGDKIDEFVLKVATGASTEVFQVYELPASEAFGDPSDVAEPGSQGFPGGKPARFSLGGSVEHYVALGCDLIQHQVIVQIAELNAERTRYDVHETLLGFAPIEAPPFGRFTVLSERDFTEPYEAGVSPGDQFEPGDPCWMQAF